NRCSELVAHESTFKANLKSRLGHLRGPRRAVPPDLEKRIGEALDRADRTGEGPTSKLVRFAAPSLGALATAAALFILLGLGRAPGGRSGGLVEAAIAGHRKNLPVEVAGPRDTIRVWMQGKLSVPVSPPDLPVITFHRQALAPQLVGARMGHLDARDAGQLIYRIGPSSQVTLY